MPKSVVWFSEIDKNDIPLVGGKGANLGEMAGAGFPVPNGFIVTSFAYYKFLKENNLEQKISHLINAADFRKDESLRQTSSHIMREITQGHLSDELIAEVYSAYKKLGGSLKDPLVAVRSSATAEDLPNASFAGQQETFLNVKGESNLLLKIKECWASLFESRAIFYRHENKFDHFKIGIAVPVQKMVESDESGVMFTIDPVTNSKERVIIEAIFGLGEMIVQGKEKPDHYEVDKKSGKILLKQISSQNKMLKKVGEITKEKNVSIFSKHKQKITDETIEKLAKLGKDLEKHYFFPQDVEWAVANGKIFLVQTRPITTVNAVAKKEEKPEAKIDFGTPILKGDPASPGIVTGEVRILENAKQIDKLIPGEILVTKQTNPDFVPAMKKAIGIITDSGGRTSHAAIVSRELGIPAIVGSLTATKALKNGQVVTLDGATGQIYKGGKTTNTTLPKFQIDPDESLKTATKVYMNLAEPEAAEIQAKRGADGVGLLRAEFMMAGIGVHPKKMIRDGKRKEFVEQLANELTKFTEAFNPRPVVYRATDFKTNEYRNLTGGKEFEPEEPNPMLGYRGAFRYIHDREVFDMELDAIKLVRNKKGFKNLWLMLPFVRTPQELAEVKKLISASGLYRSTSFKLWMMVEIPSNVILLDEFIEQGIDGVSIGTNDLTMLILGTDRDNSDVAREYDERNPAVLWAIEKVIKTAAKHGITSSICGQAATYSEILNVAVASGVTSVSVTPDMVGPTRKLLVQKEEQIFNKN